MTEEVMRLALRICSRRFPWQPLTTSIKDLPFRIHPLAHIEDSRPSLARTSVRFYSQDGVHSEERLTPVINSDGATSNKPRFPFNDHLQQCGSPSDVLDLTWRYAPTVRQISNCLTHMWSATKKMTDEQRRCELELMFEHPALDRLLQNAMKSAGHMRNEDLAYSLISMVKLGVPQRSRVVQTFLRACQVRQRANIASYWWCFCCVVVVVVMHFIVHRQEKLNDFDEKCLSIMASCLRDMKEDTPNVFALKEGMRLLVEARLPKIKNVMSLQTMMYLLGENAPLDLKRKLEEKALSLTDQFSLPNAQHMISTMATMGFYSKPLLDVCSRKIKDDLYGIPFNRLFTVLLSCKELRYRDMDLLTSISDYIASTLDLWTTKQLVLFLSVLESLAFYPAALMEAFAEKVIANPDALTLQDLLCVLKAYSSLNYDVQHRRQQFLDSLSHVLDAYLPKMSGFELLKTVYYLCQLGHFPSAQLEQLLQGSTLEQFKMTAPKFVQNQERMFQTVNLCLRLDRPPLPTPLTVPSSILGEPTLSGPSANLWFSQSMRSVLGDQVDTVLQERVVVEDFYFIEFSSALITEPPLSSRHVCTQIQILTFVQQRNPHPISSRFAVICAQHTAFCFGTSKPRGTLAVMARHLRILGFEPVLVMQQELQSMSEEQRTEFFRERIFPEHHRSDTQPKTEAAEILRTDVGV
ncbi:FAST kinase domain-containing protein 2, mitochondrial [Collichthys lucidus]|uniref:FAST kinase domain-containing protein 2, mitochondrial n=1 Tax=Collichthys lucidus TaxID=240159 RepID=A0A4U5TXE5_COLLU|nr:FAST kinase domain-containing protein 2, mitochondrial [Collichthys lucidus]